MLVLSVGNLLANYTKRCNSFIIRRFLFGSIWCLFGAFSLHSAKIETRKNETKLRKADWILHFSIRNIIIWQFIFCVSDSIILYFDLCESLITKVANYIRTPRSGSNPNAFSKAWISFYTAFYWLHPVSFCSSSSLQFYH